MPVQVGGLYVVGVGDRHQALGRQPDHREVLEQLASDGPRANDEDVALADFLEQAGSDDLAEGG